MNGIVRQPVQDIGVVGELSIPFAEVVTAGHGTNLTTLALYTVDSEVIVRLSLVVSPVPFGAGRIVQIVEVVMVGIGVLDRVVTRLFRIGEPVGADVAERLRALQYDRLSRIPFAVSIDVDRQHDLSGIQLWLGIIEDPVALGL